MESMDEETKMGDRPEANEKRGPKRRRAAKRWQNEDDPEASTLKITKRITLKKRGTNQSQQKLRSKYGQRN